MAKSDEVSIPEANLSKVANRDNLEATSDEAAKVDNVSSMLIFVDKQIHEKGVQQLQLIFYPLLHWSELQKCEHPSEVYRLLKACSVCEGSQEKALQIFIFALRAIGGRERGKYCAVKAENILGTDFTPPPLDFSRQSSKFRFFYWLLKVVKRLPKPCQDHVIQHFSNSEDVNYRFIKGLPDLFIRLYHNKKISETNVSDLIRVLEECKGCFSVDAAVVKCIDYITHNQKREDPFSSG